MDKAWVVVPAYNEEKAVGAVVVDLLNVLPNVVVVDDCSSDRTGQVALEAGAHVCCHPINLGQGAALATGVAYALREGATEIVTFDADGQHSAEDALSMVKTLRETDADVVLGSRFLGHAIGLAPTRRLLLKAALLFTRVSTGLRITDTHNGLRVFRASAAARLKIRHNRMAHASEILEQIASLRLKYLEVPCTVTYTEYSTAKGQKWSGAFAIISDLIIGRLYR